MRYSIMILITSILVLFIIASIALYSIDFAREYYSLGNDKHFFEKYILYILAGTALALLIVIFLPKDFFYNKTLMLVLYSFIAVLLILALIGPFSKKVNGANRWIKVLNSSFTFQPSELAKIFVIYFISVYITNNKDKIKNFWYGLLKPIFLISPLLILILIEPDLSTTLLIFSTAVLVLYYAGARFIHIVFLGLILGVLFLFGVEFGIIHDYQFDRIQTFLSNEIPWQLEKAYEAIENGGTIGAGPLLGKYYIHLPQAESDFILATIGEHFGFLGIVVIIVAYLFIVTSLIKISEEIKNEPLRYFIWGFSTLMMFHVVINTGVVSGLFPITGITLPFVSYGGSSILAFSIGIGIIIAEIFEEEN